MAKSWTNWEDVRARRGVDEERVAELVANLRAEMRAAQLSDLRKAVSMTQAELAEAIGIGQRRVSKIEHGDFEHSQLSTVRAYVEALGGTVEVVASFGDQKLVLS
jgi:DNA-binding XRE family transcriptional regulator